MLFIVDAPHSLIDTIIDVGSAADHGQTALDAGDLHTVFRRALDFQIGSGGVFAAANGVAPSAVAGRAGGVGEGAGSNEHVAAVFNGGVILVHIGAAIDIGIGVGLGGYAAGCLVNGGIDKGGRAARSIIEAAGIGCIRAGISAIHHGEGAEIIDHTVAVGTGGGDVHRAVSLDGQGTVVGKDPAGEVGSHGNVVACHIQYNVLSLRHSDGRRLYQVFL